MAKCEVCGRLEGSTVDLSGEEDGEPLGKVEQCDLCKLRRCPDCEAENDCCFIDADEHSEDPMWAPPGWRIAHPGPHDGGLIDGKTYERLAGSR